MGQGAPTLAEGEILAGKYRVLFVIGEGGMGDVFAAEHVQLGHRVALKVLRPTAIDSAEAVERFLREGRAAARLQSEHIARVSDVGTLESGVPFMVMELLEGQDLAHVLVDRRQLPIDEAVQYIVQASEAIAEAHRNGIVHRDLKPANLFLTKSLDGAPLVKVLDFGISKASAKILGSEAPQITSTAAMIGSPKYMSPEQMQDSRAVDERADIWALGAILYEMLSGRRAFDAATLATTCVQILQEDPPPIRKSRPDVPPELDAIVLRCMQKRPDDRFACVADLAEALAPFAPGCEPLVARIVRMTVSRPSLAARAPRRSAPSLSDGASSVAALAAGKTGGSSSSPGSDGALRTPGKGAARRVSAVAAVAGAFVLLAIVAFRGDERPKGAPAASAPVASVPPPALVAAPTAESAAAPLEPIQTSPVLDARAVSPSVPPTIAPPLRHLRARPSSPAASSGVTDSVLEDRR